MFCVKCGFKFETISAVHVEWTSRCPNCRQIEQSEKQIEAMQSINRENDLRDKQMRQMIQQQNQENSALINQLIDEQQKTQKLLQEQSITQDQAYNTGYELSLKSPSSISFITINPETGRINFGATRRYFTDILHERYLEGLWNRIQEQVTVPDREFIKQSVATAGKNAWAGIVYKDWGQVDNFKYDLSWDFCTVDLFEDDNCVVKAKFMWQISDHELRNIYETEFQPHVDMHNSTQDIDSRLRKKEKTVAELAEKQAQRKKQLQRDKIVSKIFSFWWVLPLITLFYVLYLTTGSNTGSLPQLDWGWLRDLRKTAILPTIFAGGLAIWAAVKLYQDGDLIHIFLAVPFIFGVAWFFGFILFGIT